MRKKTTSNKDHTIVFTSNQSMALYKFRLGIMLELKKIGFRVVAIAPIDGYSEKLNEKGVHFIPIQLAPHNTALIKDFSYILKLFKLYRKLSPSIIFHYTVKPNILGTIAAQLANVPICISVIPGRGYSFRNKNWLFNAVKFLYKLSKHYVDEMWFLNKEDRVFFINENMSFSDKTEVLPGEGVDTYYYCSPEGKFFNKPDATTFLFSGRLLWDKGISEYVEAARKVKKIYPNTRFHILGFLDDSDSRAVSSKIVQQWVAEETVNFMGVVEDVRPYFDKADCIVLPSYSEGLPRTLLEGASMSTPLIATNIRGSNRIVIPNKTGFLCKPKSADSLADKMIKFIKLPISQKIKMGKEGRKITQEEFEESFVIEFYLKKLSQKLNLSSTLNRNSHNCNTEVNDFKIR